MKKKILTSLAVASLSLAHEAYAQKVSSPASLPPVDMITNHQSGIITYDNISQRGQSEHKVEGSVYISDSWSEGSIRLKTGATITDVPLMYDLEKNILEINTKEGIKVLSGERVSEFRWIDAASLKEVVFINASNLPFANAELPGFYKVVGEGEKLKLLQKTYLKRMKPNYSAIMDAGNRSEKLLKKDIFFLASEEALVDIRDKNVFRIFKDKESEMQKYAEQNNLKMKHIDDALKLVEYYSTL